MKWKDAIHVATAVKLKLRFLDTFDDDLISLSGNVGDPQILIAHPPILPEQVALNLPEQEEIEVEDDEDEEDEANTR